MKRNEPEYYQSVENLLDLIYEHYTENNPAAPKTTVAGRATKEKEKELEKWQRVGEDRFRGRSESRNMAHE